MPVVSLAGRPARFTVETGETILGAALRAGFVLPHSCRSGNCGACRARLVEGEIDMGAASAHALSLRERADGLILTCRAVPWEDCVIALMTDETLVGHPLVELDCRVVSVTPLTAAIAEVRLAVEHGEPMRFTAGQYARLTFPSQPPRDYSMASRPGEAELAFHVRRQSAGGVSAFVHDRLKPGDGVILEGPFGTSYWRSDHGGPILAIAGGSGLAPIKSIVESALAAGGTAPVALYHGARRVEDLYLTDHFRGLCARHPRFRATFAVSGTDCPPGHARGNVGEVALADCAALDGAKIYLAGSPDMVEATVDRLRARGFPDADIHADAFYTAADLAGRVR